MLRKSIIIAITLLITFVFVFSFVLPKKAVLSDLQKKIQEKNRQLKAREDYFKELKGVSKNLENYQSQLAKIKLALPAGSQPLVFYDFLQKAASRSGLILKTINHGQGSGIISLNLGVTGTIGGFRNFLSLLEKSVRMINVESFSFSSPEKEKDSVDFNLKIKASFVE